MTLGNGQMDFLRYQSFSCDWQDKASLLTAKQDLAFLAIVAGGNDYVPSLPVGLNYFWRAYIAMRSSEPWTSR